MAIQTICYLLFGLAICAAPLSIAIAESLGTGSLLLRVIALARREAKLSFPRVFWFWLVWAAWEVGAWLESPEIRAGAGEIRHLLLIAALFLLTPVLQRAGDVVAVWWGLALTASISSAVLIGQFGWKLFFYRGEQPTIVYLRGGGLLHHWMVYGTVEIIIFAGLLELWHFFPERHGWLAAALAINAVAMLLSLTRMVWICALLVLGLDLVWRRSRWVWAIPAVPFLLFFLSPGAVRSRVIDSMSPDYYSNAERVQMLRVGWQMIRQHPVAGVGPGRVDELYTKYLSPSDPVPAYHGHLHNNIVQLAAEFGLPVILTALLFLTVLVSDLQMRYKGAVDREQQFLCRTSLLALAGFLASGMFDYTYGHSLGIILLSFAVLPPLTAMAQPDDAARRKRATGNPA